ncbi:hypothetical protein EDC01DRAFT_631836 [Geopyxis carbonaria]|nr:hypothetical protein EDC01DRAFT_631836 [Geopyxis carbonaria]
MALITHKTSQCTDGYSLFGHDQSIYGIPCLDRSRSSILGDTGSLSDRARPLYDAPESLSRNNTPITHSDQNSREIGSSIRQKNTIPLIPELFDEKLRPKVCISASNDRQSETQSRSISIRSIDAASFVTADSTGLYETRNRIYSPPSENGPYIFHRWMKTMFRKSKKSHYHLPWSMNSKSTGSIQHSSTSSRAGTQTISSSNKHVTAVKTASITLASFPISGNTTSRKSTSGTLDQQTIERMLDRKHALEELITTEEYYIRDLKSLKDQYIPILRDCVWISADVRQSMARNVSEMLNLHGRLLNDITRALPCTTQLMQGHVLDVSPNIGDMARYPILADPSAAAEVAKAFDTTMMAFFVYEEYAAKYQEVIKAPKRPSRATDKIHGKGTETLISASNSWDNRMDYGKRAMELYDMLFKPIQRLCKYPLLFRDIEKYTPAIDCPDTNRLLEKVRHRLDEQVHQVNIANSDFPKARERIEKTWLLQDRLDFNEKDDLPARLLGHIILCGTLHITWKSSRDIQPHTEYMACLLFKSYLILATVPKADHYKVKFAITLAVARTEQPNNGKGLYSPGAPHTWKIVFEAEHRIYEVLCSACSELEETVWRNHIHERISAESKDYQEYSSTSIDFCSCISSDIKPVGDVFGRPGTLARHQSLHRGGSSPLESDGQYIVINNLLSSTDPHGTDPTMMKNHNTSNINGIVPTVNLKRSERNRIESRLADVWTRDSIPFNATRPKTQREPNATMIMRRLSMLSLLSGSTRRSVQSTNSHSSVGECSDSGPSLEDDENIIDHTLQRSSTLAFTRTKSAHKSAPPSPTKRSSSLSSKFSFSSSTKKETCFERSPGGTCKRRSLRPILDGKWRPSALPENEAAISAIISGDITPLGSRPEQWEKAERYFSTVKPSTPPNSIQDEELSIHAALEDEYINTKATATRPLSEQNSANTRIIKLVPKHSHGLIRRHTVVASPKNRAERPWRNKKP